MQTDKKYKIIGFTGYKGSGKDTAADLLLQFGYTKYSFAEPLKQACKIMFKFSDAQLYGDKKEILDTRWNKTPREVLQTVGTNLMRSYMDDIWLKNFELSYNNEYIIIADVRFDNEANLIKKLGGIIINIDRELEKKDLHPSESGISVIDYTVKNTGSINDLRKALYTLIF